MAPSETYCPLDADSSQLAVISAAADGKTFVVEGPPGTGKSQTITNLITHCLSHGKSVLFVSEKMAALEVVHGRLEKVGMGPFSLELHSNKARKRQVIVDLGKALQQGRQDQVPDTWDATANEVATTRGKLNRYVNCAHRKYAPKVSYFQALSRLIALRDVPRVTLNFGDGPNAVSAERLAALREAVAELRVKAEPLSDVTRHAFRHSNLDNWTPSLDSQLQKELEALERAATQMQGSTKEVLGLLAVEARSAGHLELAYLHDVIDKLRTAPCVSSTLLEASDWKEVETQVESWVGAERNERSLARKVETSYEPSLLSIDVSAYYAKVSRWANAFFLFAFFALFFVRRSLKRLAKGALPANRQLAEDLGNAQALVEQRKSLESLTAGAHGFLGPMDDDDEQRWAAAAAKLAWGAEFRSAIDRLLSLAPYSADRAAYRRRLNVLAASTDGQNPPATQHKALFDTFCERFDLLEKKRDAVMRLLCLPSDVWQRAFDADHLTQLTAQVNVWQTDLRSLRDWSFYVGARESLNALGLESLAQGHFEGRIAVSDLGAAFERAFHSWFVEAVAKQEPSLANFHSGDHERIMARFREADSELASLARTLAHAQLAQNIPPANDSAPASSEIGLLMRELKKKRRHRPLRQLFSQMPELRRRLKPCMLMSPLSVAQYLDPAHPPFDLVVFDEASQIPVHEAIGAVARGKQLVVVGDSKQLPPTSFFQRESAEDELTVIDDDAVEELESILDECIAARLPRHMLGWHYRSRHEHLIAFSNYHYYENGLHTFPSSRAEHPRLGVHWRFIKDGYYDKGKSRTNRAEADAVVAEVVRRLKDENEQRRSIGVVTFSSAQQKLIEDLLDAARSQHQEIEAFFGKGVAEPVFIKNLENVQGDERDVMLFSVCYGPDASGKVSMNFGPLNREGGERRLNVAITRAREQMIVFTCMRKDHIDLRRTRAVGAAHLRVFLDYAERGPRAIAEATTVAHDADVDSPFEQDVHRALVERGWQVQPQVGCSGYRIDLGVTDPEMPGSFLLGVECDGAHYHSAKTARDRDRLRQQVLEGLGWRLHRIWSTDWWLDSKRELEKVERALAEAREQKKVIEASVNNANAVCQMPEAETSSEAEQEDTHSNQLVKEPEPQPVGMPYQAVVVGLSGDSEDFYEPRRNAQITQQMLKVIQTEAPIHQKVLARRIAGAFGLQRITRRVLKRLSDLLATNDKVVRTKGDFYWRADQKTGQFAAIRVPSDGEDTSRAIDEIPPEELANAAEVVLGRMLALDRKDLVRETARVFGISRLGQKVSARIDEAVTLLEAEGRCRVKDDRVLVED
jgi:very-short-patch-repair endonuclease